jgi:IS5 family transposase
MPFYNKYKKIVLRSLKNPLAFAARRRLNIDITQGGSFMQRINAQPTFTDLTVADLGGPKATAFLNTCQAQIPFDRLAASVAGIFKDDNPAGGAPHWPVVTMIKVLFLQKCFGLSDPMAEEMLLDRISFRRFVGLSLDDKTPDYSTISTFRKRLRDAGHGSTLFDESVRILRERGLVLNTGTLIDATIIEAPIGGKRADGSSSADGCATTTVKGGRTYHGFRAHTATDRQGILLDFVYDSANVSEHEHFDQLAANETRAVYADSGCRSKERVASLRGRGVLPGICHRRVRGQKDLTPEQKRFNRIVAPIRAFVEHPYAWIKARLNNRRARYRGLRRNAFDFAVSAMAWNFCRSFSLKPAAAVAVAN